MHHDLCWGGSSVAFAVGLDVLAISVGAKISHGLRLLSDAAKGTFGSIAN